MQGLTEYELLDVGDGARLERFGGRTVDRPHRAALGARGDPAAWSTADLRFDRDRGWSGPPRARKPWPMGINGLTLELHPTEAGQVGLFPEHLVMLPWLQARIGDARPASPAILHLFAYTGLATLAMAAAGAAVTHVDSARPTVAWARRNAELSGLDDRPVRWIVDDALEFAVRERRRGRRYAGLVLDPPSYGHGPDGRVWRLVDHLDRLLETCAGLIEADAFILLTAHTPGFDGEVLATTLARSVGRPVAAIERGELALDTRAGDRLELGAFARWPARAS